MKLQTLISIFFAGSFFLTSGCVKPIEHTPDRSSSQTTDESKKVQRKGKTSLPKPDPCNRYPCPRKLAECIGTSVITWDEGICAVVEGEARCLYEPGNIELCSSGVCTDGSCMVGIPPVQELNNIPTAESCKGIYRQSVRCTSNKPCEVTVTCTEDEGASAELPKQQIHVEPVPAEQELADQPEKDQVLDWLEQVMLTKSRNLPPPASPKEIRAEELKRILQGIAEGGFEGREVLFAYEVVMQWNILEEGGIRDTGAILQMDSAEDGIALYTFEERGPLFDAAMRVVTAAECCADSREQYGAITCVLSRAMSRDNRHCPNPHLVGGI